MFSIEMLPADEGDALWIEYGKNGGGVHRVLIDCGRKTAYRSVVQRLAEDDQIHFDLLVLTHVDADHIAGAIPLLQDPRFGPTRVDDVWFNGWLHLHGLHKDADANIPGVLNAKQGEYFDALLRARGYPWNEHTDGYPVLIPDEGELPTHDLRGGMRLTLLGPTRQKLDAMATRWAAELSRLPEATSMKPGDWERALEILGSDRRHGPDVLGAHPPEGPIDMPGLVAEDFDPDDSEPNGTSIAFLAEFDGKAALFTGDAHAPELTDAIERLCAQRGLDRLRLDACKMSHHGSTRNTSAELLGLLDCKRFLISTNGTQHFHPDRQALARVLRSQPKGIEFCFNFDNELTTRPWNNPDLKHDLGYTTRFPESVGASLRVEIGTPPDTAP
jgi:glyoxylase-like metal-dependent hydrolase (beta-lactamase superfamily II)